jgi:2-enoate reductase
MQNRIAMAPIRTGGLVNPDGSLTQRCIDYYLERARGGAGLIITGCTRVENTVERLPGPTPPGFEAMASYGELAESLHHYGAKVFVQLTAGLGRVLPPDFIDTVNTPVSSSVLPVFWKGSIMTRELTADEIQAIVQAFGEVAGRLARVGVDGIELHGHEGYLFDQFATAVWNRRTDRYGGSVEGRLRFAVEVLNAVKKEAGADFPLSTSSG